MSLIEKAPAGGTAQGLAINLKCFDPHVNLTAPSAQYLICQRCGNPARSLEIFAKLISPGAPVIVTRLCKKCASALLFLKAEGLQ